ncbi:HNH endonuclease [uncultured Adlercreutzia sp.]|uniref:HNH endonuclease n=1 Tax=uncultured Adlercreutzia sp. TaxID=875803 RepID=UPI00258623FF|nr:HNH endonuclease signature motif containing protein [uncultured Adlercreutzia sp.]
MPMERNRYPEDWQQIATAVKEEADWKCEECGKQCRRPGEPFDTHRRTLTVHHKDHTPENCERSNLVALCAPCHLKADKHHHVRTRKRRAEERRRHLEEHAFAEAGAS